MLAKHSGSFNLIDTLAVGVDRMQRNFELLQRQIDQWRETQLSHDRAKLILYGAFVEGELEAPKSLLGEVHQLYFNPQDPSLVAISSTQTLGVRLIAAVDQPANRAGQEPKYAGGHH